MLMDAVGVISATSVTLWNGTPGDVGICWEMAIFLALPLDICCTNKFVWWRSKVSDVAQKSLFGGDPKFQMLHKKVCLVEIEGFRYRSNLPHFHKGYMPKSV